MAGYLDGLFSLRGRTAVVTGGSSGIGRGIAEALGRAGARTVLVARGEDGLRRAAAELTALGCVADWVSGDLGDRGGLLAVADRLVERFGEPDILVNAAGVNLRPPLAELSDHDWDLTMAVNLDAPFLLGQRFGPGMAGRGWGRIIHIASQQSIRAFGNSGAYGVSKAGLAALTRSQAEAWSAYGVRVNAIAPGFVSTPLTRAVFEDPARREAMAARTMVGRNGEPGDFAGAALFLAGEACDYVTGQTIFVDGGFSAG
ncbi:SDR family NAD(P)-dependent oxidoreductase [Streptomyces sp. NPDC092296]|uniref:SDR family NAD(P)-dependent oxidoreductase n=1 Tax=Streptomyces sp. NPDC092296 TaxID=3366012 RepID=UPI0037F9E890